MGNILGNGKRAISLADQGDCFLETRRTQRHQPKLRSYCLTEHHVEVTRNNTLPYNRYCEALLDVMPSKQEGFRPSRSCMENVLLITTFIERWYLKKFKTFVAGIDLIAAYDTS